MAIGFVVGKSETEAELAREVITSSSDAPFGATEDDAAPIPEAPQAIPDGDLAAVKAGFVEPCKLVSDIQMDDRTSHSVMFIVSTSTMTGNTALTISFL